MGKQLPCWRQRESQATARAEQLSMEQFGALCEALYDHGLRGTPGAFSE